MFITHVDEDITNICVKQLHFLKSHKNFKTGTSTEKVALTKENIWWSGNFIDKNEYFTKNFFDALQFLKHIVEKTFHKRLKYNYLHFIDYENGGTMDYHSHEHVEDYVYILYLNDSMDGETNFYLKNLVSLTPKKSQLVIFESHIHHSGSYSKKKQIMVGGLKLY